MTQHTISVLHEDRWLIAIDKPSGLAVQGGSGVTESVETLLQVRQTRGKKLRLVHRLDRETSGVLLVAKTQPSAAFFSQAFARREVEKRYLAIVCGGPPDPAEGVIETALIRSTGKIDLMRVARHGEDGLSASTRYSTLEALEGPSALLDLHPQTGRMHQLRAHLASIGRPIAGDGKYGGLLTLGRAPIPRLMLHAESLTVAHPEGFSLCLKAPMAPDIESALAALRGLE